MWHLMFENLYFWPFCIENFELVLAVMLVGVQLPIISQTAICQINLLLHPQYQLGNNFEANLQLKLPSNLHMHLQLNCSHIESRSIQTKNSTTYVSAMCYKNLCAKFIGGLQGCPLMDTEAKHVLLLQNRFP